MELRDKVTLVTGASSGIGKAIAINLGKEGVKVALLARRKEKLKEVKKEIENNGGEALAVVADITKDREVKEAIEQIIESYEGLDILVNNAGLGIFKEVQDLAIEEWDKQINTMLRGTFLVTKFSLPYIYKTEQGHIINITSLWAKRFCGSCSRYTAAKFGIKGFTQSLREEASALTT